MDTLNINTKVMDQVVSFLQDIDYTISNKHNDGRLNSIINEEEVLNRLIKINESVFFKDNFLKMKKGKEREWYDFKIEGKNIFIPINLKISNISKNNPDNTNCKLGLFYSLTGVNPDDIGLTQQVSWDRFFKELEDHINEDVSKDKDYYFLIINKDNLKDVFYTKLKSLESVNPNANNLPFQVVWNKNRHLVDRTDKESNKFILEAFKESIDKLTIKEGFYKIFNKKEIAYNEVIRKIRLKHEGVNIFIKNNLSNVLVYHNNKDLAIDKSFISDVKNIISNYTKKECIVLYDIFLEYLQEND